MTADGLISQALGLQASFLVLRGKKEEILLSDIDRKELVSTGLTQSSYIILSFATEIALKGLLKSRFGKSSRGHDLKKLFEKLSVEDRNKISEIYNQKTNSIIENCIESHKNTFVDFRYLEGNNGVAYNSDNVIALLDSIIIYYNQIKNND